MKNKHRIFITFLLVACILLGSCNFEKQPNDSAESNETTTAQTLVETPVVTFEETTPETTPETPPTPPIETTPADNEGEDEAYLDIPIKTARGYMSKDYGLKDSSISLRMKFYLDWEHREDGEGGYLLLCDGVEIGRILSGEADDIEDWKILKQTDATPKNLQVTEYFEKSGTGESLHFRYRFYYRYMECGKERRLTVTIAYGEIDNYVQTQLRESVTYQEHHTDPMYGALSHLQDKPIVVLGNSFIHTSQIGTIYNEIAAKSGKQQLMHAESRGYASISTYAQDYTLLKRIANGEWSAVFLCGFYGRDVESVGIIKNACNKSNTQLIIFPAHNESDAMLGISTSPHPELLKINWKREIDQLIKEGRSKWDFCINDGHLHSTPLAGYVGAMMIWRAIYGEMPTVSLFSIPQSNYDAILGSYLESPTFELMKISSINILE